LVGIVSLKPIVGREFWNVRRREGDFYFDVRFGRVIETFGTFSEEDPVVALMFNFELLSFEDYFKMECSI
jgi:hypothetical protein